MAKSRRKIKGHNDQPEQPEGEQCQRCKEFGEDRRTLWQGCLYAMNELAVPFKQVCIDGHALKQIGTKKLDLFGVNHEVPVYEELDVVSNKAYPYKFFTLRVCKACRASWMAAIQDWFLLAQAADKPPIGSGIFVRRNGVSVEITEEEWFKTVRPNNQPKGNYNDK